MNPLKFLVLFLLISTAMSAQKRGTVEIDGETFPTIFKENIEYVIKGGDTLTLVREKLPEFPGGLEGLMGFIKRNIKYPKTAVKDKLEGKVFIGFIIDSIGDVKDITIVKGIREDIDSAAIKLIEKMPRWKPGTQNGKGVNVKYTLPLNYSFW